LRAIACIEYQDIIDKIPPFFAKKKNPARPRLVQPTSAPLPTCRFSEEANPQPQISKDASKKLAARTIAYYRSSMHGYELRDHRREQNLEAIGRYFMNSSSSAYRISEDIYSREVVYQTYI